MNLNEENNNTPLAFTVGRRYLLSNLGFLLPAYFFWQESISTTPLLIGLFLVFVYILLALRQKIEFHPTQLRIKLTARMPVFMPYQTVSKVIVKRKNKPNISFYSEDELKVSVSLALESDQNIDTLITALKQHGINYITEV